MSRPYVAMALSLRPQLLGALLVVTQARGVYLIPTRLQNSLIFSSLCLSAPPRWPSRTLLENALSSPGGEPGRQSALGFTALPGRQVEWPGLPLSSPQH